MLDKIFEGLKTDCAQTNLVRKAGLTMPESVTQDAKKCPLSVLTGVRIKRVYFRENI